MSTQKAYQACRACRRLKRKCSKDLPSCSLCVRLRKNCEYPETAISEVSTQTTDGRLRHLEQLLNVGNISPSRTLETPVPGFFPSLPGPAQPFPLSFFLDTDFFTPIRENALAQCPQSPVHQMASDHVEQSLASTCEAYFESFTWLPMISKKRLRHALSSSFSDDACLMLLVLCMELCTQDTGSQPMESPLYSKARTLCSASELGGFVSLRLLQSLVLLAVYELSHGIYPAAYLTISRAARLGILMGLHDRKSTPQLFKPAETWTLREEQRRTWWAIFLLDRHINIENCGVPFAAPEPSPSDLLPANDEDWENGSVVPSESLYTKSFSSVTTVGPFAQTCQSAHMLSKVMRHREARASSQDVAELLPEAQHLHQALSALHLSIDGFGIDGDPAGTLESSKLPALSICCSARLLLYNQYACNEPMGHSVQGPIALETEMQKVSLDGIRAITSSTARLIARDATCCPLVARFLYHAATECAWFINEDYEQIMYDALEEIIGSLGRLREHWKVADEHWLTGAYTGDEVTNPCQRAISLAVGAG
ncbi:fungal-specific transcription factor domain-containing protein [Thelonectria olida]|uniref:Fungal-specific transcription factor domain-containing protein n=1 Tax=Thelonectria olida TaxID=1576542 RepID=A0A9P8WAV1_9HYPO|nr:fungal-specific transcription factor domain-containing protein [Thelonectria olida]